MTENRQWQPAVGEAPQTVPADSALLTAPRKRTLPEGTELQKPRLLGMQLQVELVHSLLEFRPELIGIRFALEPKDGVISESHDDHIAVRSFPAPRSSPQIQHIVKIDVGQQGRNTTALGRPFFHTDPFPLLQHAGVEPFGENK